MQQNRNDELFTRAPIPKAFVTLCLPVVLGMVVNLLYNMVDTYFVGRLNDPNQMAAVSLCAPVFIILMGLGNIFGIGGSSVISRLMGEKQYDRVHAASSFCFWGAILVGVIVGAGLLVFCGSLLPLLGASENTADFAASYLVWILIGAPLILANFALMNILRCDGAARQSMVGNVIGSLVNIALDPILILALGMGVRGAAIATVVGYLASVIYFIHYVLNVRGSLSIAPQDVRPDGEIVTGILAIGLPASITNVLSSVSNIFLNNLLLGYGDTAIAAMGIALKINQIVTLTQVGFAGGLPPIIGYNYGAKNAARLRAVMKAACGFMLAVGAVLSVVVFALAPVMVRIFMDVEEIVAPGVQMLRALMLCGPFLGVLFVVTNFFQATGKAVPAMVLSLCRQGVVFLGVLLAMNAIWGWNGIVYAQPVADYITLIIAFALFAAAGRSALRTDA